MRVLIVDDHEVVRKGVRSLLLRSGYDVCGEGIDGEDGLAKARELRPDVIVMDVSMPRLNGLEATRRMRGILPDIQVVMLSQHESPEMVGQAVSSGARAYTDVGEPASYGALRRITRCGSTTHLEGD
jgi:DNA-binding NarL/FixJ family response regulator